jgi:alpha-tubulin suppressor-like RCC1 family protein
VRVADDHVFRSLTAGDQHACGLTAAAVAWCWGRNDRGQLGTVATGACADTTEDFYDGGYIAAVSCALAPTQAAVAPALASISASANTCGLGTDGAVVCWGIPNQPQPLTFAAAEPLIQVAATGNGVCALSRSGAVYCGGANPLARAGPSVAVRFITAGIAHQCAIGNDGIAYCWGANNVGQLGNGTHAAATAALPVAAP